MTAFIEAHQKRMDAAAVAYRAEVLREQAVEVERTGSLAGWHRRQARTAALALIVGLALMLPWML
jgi:hypothetical protein